MSENEIKPVAWQWQDEIGKWNPVQYEKAMQRGVNGYKVRVLFDQSAIEALNNQISELKTMLSIAEFQRKEMQAERDAAMADAGRYRWLRDNCQEAADYYATTGQLYFGTYGYSGIDAAIDAARAEGRA